MISPMFVRTRVQWADRVAVRDATRSEILAVMHRREPYVCKVTEHGATIARRLHRPHVVTSTGPGLRCSTRGLCSCLPQYAAWTNARDRASRARSNERLDCGRVLRPHMTHVERAVGLQAGRARTPRSGSLVRVRQDEEPGVLLHVARGLRRGRRLRERASMR